MQAGGWAGSTRCCWPSAVAGILGAPRMSNYGAAKTGLIGLTRVLAAEAADLDIRVNAIAPVAATRMMDYSMGSAAEVDNGVRTRGAETTSAEELMRPFLDRLDPALVAPVVAYLAHANARSPVRSTRSAAARSRGSSSPGPGATTTRP